MKKIISILLLLFIFLISKNQVSALSGIDFNKTLQLDPCVLLGTCPTSTPTPTPIPLECGIKGCDNSTNPCKSSLTCIQANNGSNYCTMAEFSNACKSNPSVSSCCSESPTVTQTPSTVTPKPTIAAIPLLSTTPSSEESLSPIPSQSETLSDSITVTPTQPTLVESNNATAKDMGIIFIIILLIIVIVFSNWQKIKIWLHEKTK